jgi:hypothetical protein
LHAKLTEGDPVPCVRLDSVQRALSARCGPYVHGSLREADVRTAQQQGCPISRALADARLWPVLPELLDRGADPEACASTPLAQMAQANACPDFSSASPEVLASMRWIAQADSRAVQHDVVRLLSCPSARGVGLDSVLRDWMAQGELDVQRVGFGVLGALDPQALGTPLAAQLQAQGHTAQRSLGGYVGLQPGGFELALRTSDWSALEWWLAREPTLANLVPAARGDQLAWVPMARVLTPNFLIHPQTQADMVTFLSARGARPGQRLPYDSGLTVLDLARAVDPALAARMQEPGMHSTLVARATLASP